MFAELCVIGGGSTIRTLGHSQVASRYRRYFRGKTRLDDSESPFWRLAADIGNPLFVPECCRFATAFASGAGYWSNSAGSTGSFATNGGLAGGTLGINYAGFGDWVLLGLEGDFDWSGASGSAACSILSSTGSLGPNATCKTNIDWLATFRLRAGYTWSHFLVYATAGGAVGDFRLSTSPSGAFHNPTSPLGWAAGAGVEYLFNDAISAKIEYLFVNLGTVGCPTGTLCSADNATNSGSVSFTENLIRAGVNYKFSW
jgi:outer membrane immunogenic protein